MRMNDLGPRGSARALVKANGNKVHPDDEDYDEGDYPDGYDPNASDDLTHEDLKMKEDKEREIEEEVQMEEPESRDKIIRVNLEKFLYQSIAGELVRKFIGILSIGSSIAFVAMTDTDWSVEDACCMSRDADPVCPVGCHPESDCLVYCDEFYHSRMPRAFELVDSLICFIYLVMYILILFISPNRCIFFISNESIQDLIIIIPIFIYPYECG